jgi:5-methylcytosine-specific restriction protein A
MVIHKRRERAPSLVKKKKKQILARSGALKCEVCRFDFMLSYGEIGRGFAECHHDRPVSTLKPGQKNETK